MNSQRLVPEYRINPYVSHASIRPYIDDYTYRPTGPVDLIPRPTYDYITTSNSVSQIQQKKYQKNTEFNLAAINHYYRTILY